MARGRKKKTVKSEVVKKETTADITLPLIEDIIDHKDNFIVIPPVSAPVISSAEYKGDPEPNHNNYVKKLPKPQTITEVIEIKKEEAKIQEPENKPEVAKVIDNTNSGKENADTKSENETVYPAKISEIMRRLRQNPAYRYLPDQTLIKIASSKLRSKYFFSGVKRGGGANPNFTIK